MDLKFHVATRKGWFEFSKSNNQWIISKSAFAGSPVSMTLAKESSDTYYAALDHGHFGVKLHRSDDAGQSWTEINCPQYSKSTNTEDAATLELIWSLEYAKHDNDDCLWAGTIPGGLFFSDNKGETWQLNESLWFKEERKNWFGGGYDHAGIHSICVHPDNEQHIYLGVSCAGVWVTKDGGLSWNNQAQGMRAEYQPPDKAYDPNIQDPHRMVQSPCNPNIFWVQHHNGIFRSTDNSESWQEITNANPSHFGFAVVTHPQDENKAWFVPAVKDECRIPVNGKFVVMRTTDGGESFTTESKGLPQENAYDLVYRHGLDIDASGNLLVMGSTTGNLWISEDQGDNWQLISNYLPPILAVRFLK